MTDRSSQSKRAILLTHWTVTHEQALAEGGENGLLAFHLRPLAFRLSPHASCLITIFTGGADDIPDRGYPQIDLDRTLSTQLLIEHIAGRTGLNAGEVMLMAYELCDALAVFLCMGQPVHLEKVGTFTPDVRLDGTVFVHFRPGPELKQRLNAPYAFSGRLRNHQNIGKSSDDLVIQWNKEHPEDPVEE